MLVGCVRLLGIETLNHTNELILVRTHWRAARRAVRDSGSVRFSDDAGLSLTGLTLNVNAVLG